jgi:hypothetical protein
MWYSLCPSILVFAVVVVHANTLIAGCTCVVGLDMLDFDGFLIALTLTFATLIGRAMCI